jgi:hypothetical protein
MGSLGPGSAAECTSEINAEMLKKAASSFGKGHFMLLLKNRKEFIGRLLPSYLNAYVRLNDGRMDSGNANIEMMLFVSGKDRIDDAISECSVEDARDFLIFSEERGSIESFARENGVIIRRFLDLKFYESSAADVALLGVNAK